MKKIADIINEFDPLDLLPYAPPDEYEREIEEITFFLQNHKESTADMLAHEIYDVFIQSLGKEIFNKSIKDCYAVAIDLLRCMEKK